MVSTLSKTQDEKGGKSVVIQDTPVKCLGWQDIYGDCGNIFKRKCDSRGRSGAVAVAGVALGVDMMEFSKAAINIRVSGIFAGLRNMARMVPAVRTVLEECTPLEDERWSKFATEKGLAAVRQDIRHIIAQLSKHGGWEV
ncbi:hypothetical protein CYMTET_4866 [Cymbomonas tetramitiformis]|uniref:Uncharacterized protein n=1 Tax=Cymbomonas tetramitiformis TaxID=36881 RepID=A0AAE0LJP4_9CHLO|nr:hypothetical protein CYMTET_4866 [Cymbomonas tetramitiformis]